MGFRQFEKVTEIAPLINGLFNPPMFTPDFSEEAWEREYSAVHEQIFECLQQAEAAMTGLAEEAFSMGEPFSNNRSVGVVVDYIDLLSANLLRQLQSILAHTPQDYRIIIDGSDRNGKQYWIVITKEDTISYAENAEALSPLNSSPTEA